MKLPVLMFLDSFENKCILKLSLNHWNIWQTTKLEGGTQWFDFNSNSNGILLTLKLHQPI